MKHEFNTIMEELKGMSLPERQSLFQNYKEYIEEKRVRYPKLCLFEVLTSLREEKELLFHCLRNLYEHYEHTHFLIGKLSNKEQQEIVQCYYEALYEEGGTLLHVESV